MARALVWFRNDLRLEDNPAWSTATSDHDTVVPLVIFDQRLLGSIGSFRRSQWLANVAALDAELEARGGRLSVFDGDPAAVLSDVADAGDSVFVNSPVSRWGIDRDARVEDALGRVAVPLHRSWGTLVTEPGTVLTGKGTLSRVFSAFHRAWEGSPYEPWPEPGQAVIESLAGVELPDGDDPPDPPGTAGAHDRLEAWLERVDDYESGRDIPAELGTSVLSSALRFGTISPRRVLDLVGTSTSGRAAFCRQLSWRDWYAHLMLEFPDMMTSAIRPEYDRIAWLDDDEGLAAWQEGRTGYPIVDAGMRQLATTGWMHNRVRMIAGSFLVKDLLVDWRAGERWFRHLLTDADPSQNAGNWQWVAGTGTDAAPYFRVFNPVSQSRKFDPTGAYVRTWVPELAGLDGTQIHAPWEVPPLELAGVGVTLGDTYPEPIVDHAFARDRALAAYKTALGR